jgi:hypothetical protein
MRIGGRDEGCGCIVPGAERATGRLPGPVAAGLLALLAFVAARRRR